MGACAAGKCRNHPFSRNNRGPVQKRRFFGIPTVKSNGCEVTIKRSERRRAAWLSKLKKNGLNDADIKKLSICSDHFVSGAPSSLHDESNVDWVPSLNLGSSDDDNEEPITEITPSCQMSSSLGFASPASTSVPEPCNHISPASYPSNAFLSPVSRPSDHTSRQPSSDCLNSISPINSPVKVSRSSTPNVKCYKRKVSRRSLSQSDQSGECNSFLDQSDSLSESHHDFIWQDRPQDALAETVSVGRAEYAALQAKAKDLEEEYRKKFEYLAAKVRRLRDNLTDMEVDKLELQKQLKSSEEAMSQMTKVMNNMEEDYKHQEAERIAEIQRNHENLSKKCEAEMGKIRKEAMEADVLTFRNLEVFSSNEPKVKFYTGLCNYKLFQSLLKLLLDNAYDEKALERGVLAPWQCLLLTLMRLRLGLLVQDLAYRFGVHYSTVIRHFDFWLDALYLTVCPCTIRWPDRETLRDTMPREFREVYGDSVAVIIDCFEVFTEKPSALDTRGMVCSKYKHHHTVKVLIGISPMGAIMFVSNCRGAQATDKKVVAESGLYELLLPYDAVMADRGFDIADELAMGRARLLIPAFTRAREQLSSHDVTLTRQIAKLRVHVERVLGLVRRKYKILKTIIPVKLLTAKEGDDMAQIDKIVHVCCALTNFSPSIVSHPDLDPLTSSESEDGML